MYAPHFEIHDGVTSIGKDAFWGCDALKSITIPDSVISIGDKAFARCTALENITIPNSVINIENYVFAGCNSLQSINVSEGNSNYLSCGDVLFDKSKSVLIKYPEGEKDTSYIIPDGVTSIGDFAFMYCKSLKSITIPDSVTSIEEDAFSQCKSLKSITIPNSVTSIGDGAFMYCESLQSITIPENVTSDEVTVTVKVNPIAMKMWALKYSKHIKVIFPQSLVDEIKADIDFAKKNYE